MTPNREVRAIEAEGEPETVSWGAVDLSKCPYANSCRCEYCAYCGCGKHMAVHGPFYGKPPGSKPYDHLFIPRARRSRASQQESGG